MAKFVSTDPCALRIKSVLQVIVLLEKCEYEFVTCTVIMIYCTV